MIFTSYTKNKSLAKVFEHECTNLRDYLIKKKHQYVNMHDTNIIHGDK